MLVFLPQQRKSETQRERETRVASSTGKALAVGLPPSIRESTVPLMSVTARRQKLLYLKQGYVPVNPS